jgi:hypothetical protein
MADSEGLERLLEALAREDAPGVIDEARALARERVRDHLADELERRLMAQVRAAGSVRPKDDAPRDPPPVGAGAEQPAGDDSPHAPAPSRADGEEPGGGGVYVYAVVDGPAESGLSGELRGVAGATVRVIDEERLRALVSDVPLDQFDDEALRDNLNDLTWLSETAVAHEAVVEAALGVATVVPMRLCTIFRSDAAVREMLVRERAGLEETLDRLRGSSEWGVKVIADARAVEEAVGRRSAHVRTLRETIEGAGEGAGYLAARQLERLTQGAIHAEIDARTQAIHEALSALATDGRLNPPSNRDLAGYTGDMVLNAAYLVPDARRGEFSALVESLASEHRDFGLTVDLTGPWPPYNFSTMAGAL